MRHPDRDLTLVMVYYWGLINENTYLFVQVAIDLRHEKKHIKKLMEVAEGIQRSAPRAGGGRS